VPGGIGLPCIPTATVDAVVGGLQYCCSLSVPWDLGLYCCCCCGGMKGWSPLVLRCLMEGPFSTTCQAAAFQTMMLISTM
jgi:hypothetical protein